MIWALVGLVTLLGLVALRDAMHGDRRRKEEEAVRWWRERQEAARKAARDSKQSGSDGHTWS